MDEKSCVGVILRDPAENPWCTHGPTILLTKIVKGIKRKNFFVCAAQRDRKFCPFYLREGAQIRGGLCLWKQRALDFIKNVNHRKMFVQAHEVKLLKPSDRIYCSTCSKFLTVPKPKHEDHKVIKGITDEQFRNPTEILPPSEIDKVQAQYWFLKSTVEDIVDIFKSLNYRNVICIGTPRIFEYIRNNCENTATILLDMDKRFHNFFGPVEFCWYNMLTSHFYIDEAKEMFLNFLKMDGGDDMVIILDPPFGVRTELVSFTLKQITETYQKLNNRQDDIPLFWIFPYYNEPHVYHSNRNFSMLDYKVEYENHSAFGNGPKARKQGSPVRIFTTVKPSLIKLPEDKGYRYCDMCDRWVANENNHCDVCNDCTSKNGAPYAHCDICKRCVKVSWEHCTICRKCTQKEHHCVGTKYSKPCIHCKSFYHKSRVCPIREVIPKNRKRKAAKARKRKMDKMLRLEKESEDRRELASDIV